MYYLLAPCCNVLARIVTRWREQFNCWGGVVVCWGKVKSVGAAVDGVGAMFFELNR
jgi:hypothetical protein